MAIRPRLGKNIDNIGDAATDILGLPLTGYVTGTNTPITSSNTILTALEDLQAQVTTTASGYVQKLTGNILFNFHSGAIFDITNDGNGGDYSKGYLYFSSSDVELGWGINYLSIPLTGAPYFKSGGGTVMVPTGDNGTLALTSELAAYLPLTGGIVNGDIEITDNTKGLILTSTGGFRFKYQPDDSGNLIATPL